MTPASGLTASLRLKATLERGRRTTAALGFTAVLKAGEEHSSIGAHRSVEEEGT